VAAARPQHRDGIAAEAVGKAIDERCRIATKRACRFGKSILHGIALCDPHRVEP